jgi:hypothetical protein
MGIATKWPRLIVVGNNVTPDQADQILIRTNYWHSLFSNDKQWQAIVATVVAEFGYPAEPDPSGLRVEGAIWARIEAKDRWRKHLGVLDLGYLHNWQIMSAWFGGPHGWCNWDGQIGCTTFNIGKWPSENEVTGEWRAIAAAFPYLRLTAQCIEDEGEGVVAGTWTVADGTVNYVDGPADRIAEPTDVTHFRTSERGVEYTRLRRAFEAVVAAGRA